MKSFRYTSLLLIVIFSVFLSANADLGDILHCGTLSLLNFLKCYVPIINSKGSDLKCLTDCVCTHGFSNSVCKGGKCICYDDEFVNETKLNEIREQQCNSLSQKVIQVDFIKSLCPDDDGDGICDHDCICGHNSKRGICVDNAYKLDGQYYKVCKCQY